MTMADMWRARSGDNVALRDAVDRLFEQAFVGPGVGQNERNTSGQIGMRVPLNVYEEDDAFHIWALLPGVDPEKIQITAIGETIAIEAETAFAASESWKPVWSEWQPARWRRQISLPSSADIERADVVYEQGVLRMRLPKPEEVRPKSLKVNVRTS